MSPRKRFSLFMFRIGTSDSRWVPKRVSNRAWRVYRNYVIRNAERRLRARGLA